jgi:hypothetical protein
MRIPSGCGLEKEKALSGSRRTGLLAGIFAQIAITPIMAKI